MACILNERSIPAPEPVVIPDACTPSMVISNEVVLLCTANGLPVRCRESGKKVGDSRAHGSRPIVGSKKFRFLLLSERRAAESQRKQECGEELHNQGSLWSSALSRSDVGLVELLGRGNDRATNQKQVDAQRIRNAGTTISNDR